MNKAQIMPIILLVLVIFVSLSINISQKTIVNFRIAKFYLDKLKAFCLARSAIIKAINEIEIDEDQNFKKNEADFLDDNWANNKSAFERIYFDNPKEYAQVYYFKPYVNEKIIFGAQDEESKININAINCPVVLLKNLLENSGVERDDILALLKDIQLWKGDIGVDKTVPSEDYLNFKREPFSNIEELLIILENFYSKKNKSDYQAKVYQIYKNIAKCITVYPKQKKLAINPNTADEKILEILIKSLATEDQKDIAKQLTEEIIFLRRNKIFKNEIDIASHISHECKDLFNKIKTYFVYTSNYFTINSIGYVNKANCKITVVYDREKNKIIYWHQN